MRQAGQRLPPGALLQCSSARPANRYLLVALIDGLRDREARLVVVARRSDWSQE
jgi:hypothetical protein